MAEVTVECGIILSLKRSEDFIINCKFCNNHFEEFHSFKEHYLLHCGQLDTALHAANIDKGLSSKFVNRKSEIENISNSFNYDASSPIVKKNAANFEKNSEVKQEFLQLLDNSRTVPKEIFVYESKSKNYVKESVEFNNEDELNKNKLLFNSKKSLRKRSHITIISNEQHNCGFCDEIFLTNKKLNAHLRQSHTNTEGLFECQHCGKKFKLARRWKAHLILHTGEKPYKCNLCDKYFAQKKSRKLHEIKHEGIKRYKCDQCDKEFYFKSEVERHNLTHSQQRPYECDICNMTYTTSNGLFHHKKLKHPELIPFECDKCLRGFGTNCKLQLHECTPLSEFEIKAELFKRNERKKLPPTEKYNSGEIRQCGVKIVNSKEVPIYKRPPKKHGNCNDMLLPYICEFCAKGFKHKNKYEIHKRVHTGEKPYKCTGCEKSFATKYQLTSHFTIHTGEKPYKCTECGKQFRLQNPWLIHVRAHTGEKPFKCEIMDCNKAFYSRGKLDEHKKHAHNIYKENRL